MNNYRISQRVLELFPFPNIVWTLSPAVGTSLIDAILALEPIKNPTLILHRLPISIGVASLKKLLEKDE
jgi:hypothetical protein